MRRPFFLEITMIIGQVVVLVFIYRVQKLAINQRNENTLTKKSDEVKRKTIISSLMATRSPSLLHLKIGFSSENLRQFFCHIRNVQ